MNRKSNAIRRRRKPQLALGLCYSVPDNIASRHFAAMRAAANGHPQPYHRDGYKSKAVVKAPAEVQS